ncbi:PREDICTED: chaperone protein dnaJ 20, chloroplastic-like [Nicotiana attenuata]|uniref:Chaperone protein dnaj 20, chloroplastic n=1 Tax=Nicotiana attenuata TaxID=49451 RepID=A0A1J6K480_NICAT|nr:PREDICTED: chaperone protein dnaJ 20, chloroplastic-like [Nicotiana attenuata]OIT23460.1 chaperone protein dnaj 20, chloroplastic [Nicotiana attenuata]
MCCNSYGLIPTSSPPPPSISPSSLHPRIYFPNYPSNSQVLGTKFGSLKAKSKLNDVVSYAEIDNKSFYDLLVISETGTLLEIKQAYKQLARKYHPDVSPPDRVEEYTQRFIRVQEAYETLSDPRMRDMYDKDMAKGLHFAFSARRRYQSDESMGEKGEWKNRWQSQLSELKRRSMHKDSGNSMSWGARMRKQRNEASS